MVASYYLIKPLYSLCWRVLNIIKPRTETVFYCHSAVDLQNWLPVQKHLKPIAIVSDKANTRKDLRQMGYRVRALPAFPKAVIMCRVGAHKFPSRKVIKIGMTHGAYHFKRFPKAANYNLFDLYLFTSQQDLANAVKLGVKCGKVGGYPKLDPYLPAHQANATPKAKPKLLFTATYDGSGMSAIHLWLDHLAQLSGKYEVSVSLHPWMSEEIKARVAAMPGIHYVGDNPLPSISKADVCAVDRSSVIAEICALNKAMISWILPPSPRSVAEITDILERCSIRISSFIDLEEAIKQALSHPEQHQEERAKASRIFFDHLDGQAGQRSADHIIKLLPELEL
jgi:hypothetical protein